MPVIKFRCDRQGSILLQCFDRFGKEGIIDGLFNKGIVETEVNGFDKKVIREHNNIVIFCVINNMVWVLG